MIIYNKNIKDKVEDLKKRTELEKIILNLENKHEKDEETLKELSRLKKSIKKLQEQLPDDSHKKYLSEIILEEKPKFESNNLILAPVGSGKTTLIKDVLIDKSNQDKVLMLVSTRFLKESTSKSSISSQNNELKINTSKTKKKDDNSVHMMTYHELGLKIKDNNKFVDKFTQIFCDEIHSLPEYRDYGSKSGRGVNFALEHAMKYLFSKQEGKQIFYFTATGLIFERIKKSRPGLIEDIKVYDYTNHPDIKRYMELSKSYITHIEQIRPFLRDRKESFDYFKSKGLAFTSTITNLKAIESILIEEGYSPLTLWSDANSDYKLSQEQLDARDELIKTNKIPEGYNFLLMNSALREGWDLKDPRVRLAIMNTTDEVDIVQARGRIRKDIDLIIYKTVDGLDKLNTLELVEKYIDKPLTTEDKEMLCEELDIRDKNNRLRKWRTVKPILEKNGYNIKDSKVTINGERKVVSTISIVKGYYGT